jgi:hypothetical protein
MVSKLFKFFEQFSFFFFCLKFDTISVSWGSRENKLLREICFLAKKFCSPGLTESEETEFRHDEPKYRECLFHFQISESSPIQSLAAFCSLASSLADIYRFKQRHNDAWSILQNAQTICDQHDCREGAALVYLTLTKHHIEMRSVHLGTQTAVNALAFAAAHNHSILYAKSLLLLSFMYSTLKISPERMRMFWKQFAQSGPAHVRAAFTDTSTALGDLGRSDPDEILDQALYVLRSSASKDLITEADILKAKARVAVKKSQKSSAMDLLLRATAVCASSHDMFGRGEALCDLARLFEDKDKTLSTLNESLKCFESIGAWTSCANVHRMVAETQFAKAQISNKALALQLCDSAAQHLNTACDLYKQCDRSHGLAASQRILAEILIWRSSDANSSLAPGKESCWDEAEKLLQNSRTQFEVDTPQGRRLLLRTNVRLVQLLRARHRSAEAEDVIVQTRYLCGLLPQEDRVVFGPMIEQVCQ